VASLQEILKAPKIRGGFGELMLKDLLMQCCRRKTSSCNTRSGAVGGGCHHQAERGMVSVDSKFPLKISRKLSWREPKTRNGQHVQFYSDVKNMWTRSRQVHRP
jgi:DNA anti-recombination protein RmuC